MEQNEKDDLANWYSNRSLRSSNKCQRRRKRKRGLMKASSLNFSLSPLQLQMNQNKSEAISGQVAKKARMSNAENFAHSRHSRNWELEAA
jgi:hypothetical protein